MKSLLAAALLLSSVTVGFAQVRIPIARLPYVISKSGNYFVSKDLVLKTRPAGDHLGGIVVTADDVDLDLNGRTLEPDPALDSSPSTKYTAIVVKAHKGITIRNGTVRNLLGGVNVSDGAITANGPVRIEGITVTDCPNLGVEVYSDNVSVRNCTVRNVSNGLSIDIRGNGSSVEMSRVFQASSQGIYVTGGGAVVRDCQVTGTNITNTGTYGIYLSSNGVVERCYVEECYVGILGGSSTGSVVRDNTIVGCAATFGNALDGGGNK